MLKRKGERRRHKQAKLTRKDPTKMWRLPKRQPTSSTRPQNQGILAQGLVKTYKKGLFKEGKHRKLSRLLELKFTWRYSIVSIKSWGPVFSLKLGHLDPAQGWIQDLLMRPGSKLQLVHSRHERECLTMPPLLKVMRVCFYEVIFHFACNTGLKHCANFVNVHDNS